MNGLQIAGIANITAKDLNGAQIGLCNYATKAHGFQIGLVNYYREDMKGLQLGLVNANPDTRIQMMVYGGNVTPANIGVRFKNQLFYTILGVGAFDQNLNDKFSISTSYRAGLAVPVYKGLSISGDLGFQHIETTALWIAGTSESGISDQQEIRHLRHRWLRTDTVLQQIR